MSVSADSVLAIAAALGANQEELKALQAAIGGSQAVVRQTTAPQVKVLTGEQAKKFGDVSISKRKGDTVIPKLGVFAEDLPQFISDLQAALDELTTP